MKKINRSSNWLLVVCILIVNCQLSIVNCFGQITRSQIFANADPYTTYTFSATAGNIGSRTCSGVGTETAASWVAVGSNTSMPYCWGGFSTRASFTSGLTSGKLAGDVTTSTSGDCCETCALGVDCSGYVSRAWALTTKYSTSTLPNISTAYASASQVQLGDIFNYAGSHVRLVNTNYGNGSYQVMESSANGWHVAYNTYTASQLTSYVPRYYVNVTNAVSLDAGVPSITFPVGTLCNATVAPVVKMQNFGTTALTSCTINYHYDSNPNQTYAWTGSLATGISATVTLPSMTVPAGTHTFICSTSNPNGGADGNTSNDQLQTAFNIVNAPAALPLAEGFESSSNLPSGWTLWNPDFDAAWQIVTTLAHTGSNCIGFNNCLGNGSGNNMTGTKDRFITTAYDFSNATSALISFDVAYTTATTSKVYADTLALFSSTDCGSTWNQIYLKGGTNLATAPTATVSQPCWSPTSSDWRTDNVSLNSLIGHASVMFAFENRSDWGEWIYLDNISITAVTGIESVGSSNGFSIYPNPASSVFTIEGASNAEKIHYAMYSIVGAEVKTGDIETNGNNFNGKIHVSDISSGMYFIKVSDGKNTWTKKINIL